MKEKTKDILIFFLLGIIVGFVVIVCGGVIVYKALKGGGSVQQSSSSRYEEKKSKEEGADEKKGSSKKSAPLQDFFLSFENENDLNVFETGGGITLEISSDHATHGKRSLKAVLQGGAKYPGLMWEVFGSKVLNWKGRKDLHFDVYNEEERPVNLEVKFKSGRKYPKKSSSYSVELGPLKMNQIDIPMEAIAGGCDINQMSYVKIFVKSIQAPVALYFDNLGVN